MRKKIVFKTKAFPVLSETFVVMNVVQAIKNGFQVKVITDKKNDFSLSSQEHLLNDYSVSEKIQKFSESKKKSKRYLKALGYLLDPVLFYYYIKYAEFKKKKSLSLLFLLAFYYPHRRTPFHVHFATALGPLLELKKIGFIRSKIIVSFHGYDGHFLPCGHDLNKLLENFRKHVFKITVNSVFLKNKLILKGFNEADISIIKYGIDLEYFKRKRSVLMEGEYFNMISVGRLVEFKGHKIGVKVVKLLSEKGYKVKYTIIGEGPELQKLKDLIRKLNLEKSVSLLGKKNQQEIKEHLNLNQLFLMTSTTDNTGRQEDFGVVSLEAQAMQLPVIGFKAGGFPETLVDGVTGLLVEDKDVEAMATVVESLIKDKRRIIQMGKQGRRHVVENFSFDKTTRKYLELY